MTDQIRKAAHNATGGIDIEVFHDGLKEWIPYTARPDDPEDASGAIWAAAQAAKPEPFVDPSPEAVLAAERAGMSCSRFQAKAALMIAGHLPAVESALLESSDIARLAWAEAVEFRRNSPTIAALSSAIGLTDEQVDDLFRAAIQIEA